MTLSDKESFIEMFKQWAVKWDKFLKERSIDKKTKKSYFVHKKLRSAYHSIKRNMQYLWAFYDNQNLKILNTNNGLERQLQPDFNSNYAIEKGGKSFFCIFAKIFKNYEHPFRPIASEIIGSRKRV